MSNVVCSACNQNKLKKNCLKVKNNQNQISIVCKNCRPEYEQEINFLWNNEKLKLSNLPIKKVE